MIKFSRNNLKYLKGQSPPENSANGNVHTDILLSRVLGIIALDLVIQNNFRWV